MKNLLAALFAFISVSGFSQEENDMAQYKPVQLPAGFTSQLNVIYTKGKNWEEKMDIYLPPKGVKPSPVVINIGITNGI